MHEKCYVPGSVIQHLQVMSKETTLVSIFKNNKARQLVSRKIRFQIIFQLINVRWSTRGVKHEIDAARVLTLKVLLQTMFKLSLDDFHDVNLQQSHFIGM